MQWDPATRRRLAYLLESPLRRRGLVIVPALLVSLAAAGIALLLPPRYKAAALVRADWVGLEAARQSDPYVTERRGLAIRERATERALLERVVGETSPYPPGSGPAELAGQVERLRSGILVRSIATSAFAVEFEHEDAAKASSVPNAIARLLVERSAPHAAAGQSPIAAAAVLRFELLTPASVPASPESRGLPWYAVLGALAGLLLGLLAAVVAEHRDRSVKGPEDLAEILPAPLLATLPEVRERERRR